MPQVKLFIATSLDGYIARPDGAIDWLFTDGDYGYRAFIKTIDVLLMGRATYEQVLTFGDWPYDGPALVFTRTPPSGDHPRVTFVSDPVEAVVADLKARYTGDLWLVGGTGLITSFREQGLIDAYIISVHPILLGDGIPLFEHGLPEEDLRLVRTDAFESGLVQLTYERA